MFRKWKTKELVEGRVVNCLPGTFICMEKRMQKLSSTFWDKYNFICDFDFGNITCKITNKLAQTF